MSQPLFRRTSVTKFALAALALGAALPACRERLEEIVVDNGITGGVPAVDTTTNRDGLEPAMSMAVCGQGEYRCVGAALQACAEDGSGFLTLQVCDSEALCQADSRSCGAASCVADEMTCQGAELVLCNTDRTGFAAFATCETPAHCTSAERRCLDAPCDPGGLRCNRQEDGASALERCNEAQTDWESLDICVTRQLCDLTISNNRRVTLGDQAAPEEGAEGSQTTQCLAAACQVAQTECQGASLAVCNIGQTAFEILEQCATAELCQLSQAVEVNGGVPRCVEAVCEAGDFRCTTAGALEVCEANRTGFRVVQQCIGAPFCDAPNGTCNDAPCEAGAESCNDSQPQRCRDDQTGFDAIGSDCLNAALCNDAGDSAFCDEPTCRRGELASDEFLCDGVNLLRCNENLTDYEPNLVCVTAELCDAESGACTEPTCQVGENNCEGGTLQVCNAGQTGFDDEENCGDASQCDATAGACTDPCEPGSARCTPQGEIEQCADRLTGWQITADCITPELCDADTRSCTPPACQAGDRRCDSQGQNALVQQCAPGRDRFDTLVTCQGGQTCDAANGECDICAAGGIRCEGDTLVTCSGNGQFESRQQCGQGLCSADVGRCLECGPIGSARCQGTQLFVCEQGFQAEVERAEFCQTGELCQETLRACGQNGQGCQCNEGECRPGQVRCFGNALQQCNPGLTDFNFLTNCEEGLCNAAARRCDECSGNASFCTDGNTRQFCNNGLFQTQDCFNGQICNEGQCIDPACSQGQVRCFGNALQQCNGTRTDFNFTENCPNGLCNAGARRCDECAGNGSTCVGNGNTREFCNNGLIQRQNCAGGQICQGGACVQPACNTGQFNCFGNALQQCNSDRSDFNFVQNCDQGLCNAGARRCDECAGNGSTCVGNGNTREFCSNGSLQRQNCAGGQICQNGGCVDAVCNAGQFNCNGNLLQQCNDSRSGFNLVEDCDSRRCNSGSGQCDECSGTESFCRNGDIEERCINGRFVLRPCIDGEECQDNACAPAALVCPQGALFCQTGQVRNCAADGLSSTPTPPCSGNIAIRCVGDRIVTDSCTAEELCSNDGICVSQVSCVPRGISCQGNQLQVCNEAGDGFERQDSCIGIRALSCQGGTVVQDICNRAFDETCDPGTGTCECPPNTASCDGLRAGVCNANGRLTVTQCADRCENGVCQRPLQ